MRVRAGGDDYVTKPFNIKEVILRIKAQLKRGLLVNMKNENSIYNFGDVVINEDSTRIKKGELVLL